MAVLIKSPERVRGVCEHIVEHFRAKVEPNDFKGMIVTFDRECCDIYKKTIDDITNEPELTDVVMSVSSGEDKYAPYRRDRDAEEKLLDRFRDPARIAMRLIARLRKHAGDPHFVELDERLEKLRERHEKGLDDSKAFLKKLLQLAHEVVEAEKITDPEEEQDQAKAALTELFQEVKQEQMPIIVERIVNDIDNIVRFVRFDGWQHTSAGEREVKKALRKVMLNYKLRGDQELFDKAYGYIKQYY